MPRPLDDLYFEWLYSKIAVVRNRNPARSYWGLARQLFTKEFVWLVANDNNRIEDARELRYEFAAEQGIGEPPEEWLFMGCSMLEMLIALARRAGFESDEDAVEWFWRFMVNLGIHEYNDYNFDAFPYPEIDEVLDRVIFRTYSRNGEGGLFPLTRARRDQRKVELWYQLASYLIEM